MSWEFIGDEMQRLLDHAKMASSGVADVSRGATLIAQNAERDPG